MQKAYLDYNFTFTQNSYRITGAKHSTRVIHKYSFVYIGAFTQVIIVELSFDLM